jgi:hypothetical protein
MPKYLVTWTTNAEVIEAEDEEEAHTIATALAADGLAFQEYVSATIVELEDTSTVWLRKDVELGGA